MGASGRETAVLARLLRETGSPAMEVSAWYLELDGALIAVEAEEWEPYTVLVPSGLASRSCSPFRVQLGEFAGDTGALYGYSWVNIWV